MNLKTVVLTVALTAVSHTSFGASIGGCKFDTQELAFSGDVAQQTKCLLRKVKSQGAGATPQAIPTWLSAHVGKEIAISDEKLKTYLLDKKVDAADIGGPLVKGAAAQSKYFVIHDTSSPEIPEASGFPKNMDETSYGGNNLQKWNGNIQKQVNLIVGRDGNSRTYHSWGQPRPWSGVKLEMQKYVPASRPLFVHVENIQPRLKPANKWAWIAPQPGLSAKQEERLALAYVAASYQAGRWLIPAYHFNVDEGLPDGHDDPQNMDLQGWVNRIEAIDALLKK